MGSLGVVEGMGVGRGMWWTMELSLLFWVGMIV